MAMQLNTQHKGWHSTGLNKCPCTATNLPLRFPIKDASLWQKSWEGAIHSLLPQDKPLVQGRWRSTEEGARPTADRRPQREELGALRAHRPPLSTLASLGRARVSGIQPRALSYLERQGGRWGRAAPAGLEERTMPAEPGAPGPRGRARALSAPRALRAGCRRLATSPGPGAFSRGGGSQGLGKGASHGVLSLRVRAPHVPRGRTARPGLPARGGTAATVAHAASRARGSAWPGLPPSTGPGGRGSASAPPPCIHVPGFLLSLFPLVGSRATGSSWCLCPTALPLRGRGSRAPREPEGPACREAGPGTRERASLFRAPCGRSPGGSQGGAGARRGGPQLHGEEGSFHLLLLSHVLQGLGWSSRVDFQTSVPRDAKAGSCGQA